MKVKFLRAVGTAGGVFHKDEVHEVSATAAEIYVAHGYAQVVEAPPAGATGKDKAGKDAGAPGGAK